MFKKSNIGKFTEAIQGVHLKTTVYGEKTLMCELEIKLEKGALIPAHKRLHEQTGWS